MLPALCTSAPMTGPSRPVMARIMARKLRASENVRLILIAIIIRQCTSGLVNAVILVSILSIMGGDGIGSGWHVLGACLTDMPSYWMLFVAGVFSSWSFKFWYKGASMCGAALGMGCNGAYAFWGPFWCYIVLGLIFGWDGYAIPWQGWVGAVVMVIGIVILAISQDKATREA